MISQKVYDELNKRYSDVASWAVWSPVGEKHKSNTGDMTVFDNKDLLSVLKADVVFVGLNASVHEEREDGYTGSWRMFHSDDNKRQRDFKLRFALKDTPYWGSYMTDIVNNSPLID